MEDSQIIDLYWDRDEKAIKASKNKYGVYCLSVAHNILGDYEDSEECLNDTWLRAWNAIPPARPNNLKAYLAKLIRNLAIDKVKANKAKKRGGDNYIEALDELAEVVAGPGNPEDQVITNELGGLINKWLRGLKQREANVFIRRYFYTESIATVAENYGLSQANTRVILTRLRVSLKEYLQEEGYL